MLHQVELSATATASPCLKNAAVLGQGVLQATRVLHTGQPHLAPKTGNVYGGKESPGLPFLCTGHDVRHVVQSISLHGRQGRQLPSALWV
uniref:Uncharacterized protein n=1 Tax=Peromyscus maniculatus bairdii TaxID=230844 RepID=A0A8C8W4U9_PERMB